MSDLKTPTVNLNGNDGKDLFLQAWHVKEALDIVLNTLNEATDLVHGRNFPAESLTASLAKGYEAREAFDERRQAVAKLASEFERLALDLHDQVTERKTSKGAR